MRPITPNEAEPTRAGAAALAVDDELEAASVPEAADEPEARVAVPEAEPVAAEPVAVAAVALPLEPEPDPDPAVAAGVAPLLK